MDITVWFQSWVSPGPTMPSGHAPGVLSTAPTLMLGSTAFMADTYCSRLVA